MSGEKDTILYLEKVLNSPIIDWYYRTISMHLGSSAIRMLAMYVLQMKIPFPSNRDLIDIYNLDKEEVDFINNNYTKN